MIKDFKSETIKIPGTFGERFVKISALYPRVSNGINILMLHGVHSAANLSPQNKFRRLACISAKLGYTPWLCETSRNGAAREDYGENIDAWKQAAFCGKTFQNEFDDERAALGFVCQKKPEKLWVLGFSLGGLVALALATRADYPIERVILCGSGLSLTDDLERSMMTFPILSTVRASLDVSMLKDVKAKEIYAFRGSNDEIFTEEACLALLSAINIPEENKKYFEIEGADHAMKTRNGERDQTIMDEIASRLATA